MIPFTARGFTALLTVASRLKVHGSKPEIKMTVLFLQTAGASQEMCSWFSSQDEKQCLYEHCLMQPSISLLLSIWSGPHCRRELPDLGDLGGGQGVNKSFW